MVGVTQWPFRRALSAYSGGTVMDFHHLPLSVSSLSCWLLLKKCCLRTLLEGPADGYERRKGYPRRAGFRVLIDEHLAAVHDP